MIERKEIWKPYEGAQKRLMSCPVWEVLLHGNRGGGKSIKSSTYVISTSGKIKLKDLTLNDMIFGRDGNPYPITGIFPQGMRTQYKLSMGDGRTIYCDADHKWTVLYNNYNERVFSTQEMIDKGLFIGNEKYNNYKFRIPNCEPINFPKAVLPIDPYILGCLISEGTLTQLTPRIATSQQHILDRIKRLYPDFVIRIDKRPDSLSQQNYLVDKNKKGPRFPGVKERSYSANRNRLNEAIVHLGLNVTCKHKFIPEIYKFASIEQRMELLQGLMDTDGSVGKTGHSEFNSTSNSLINDVAWLCRSLGIRCRIDTDKREGRQLYIRESLVTQGISYRLYINTSLPISKILEKLKRLQNKPITNMQKYVPIVSIEKSNKKVHMTCISVGSPDHTYITKDFIVTHNTDVLLMDYLQEVGVGHGIDYKGLLLREATTELGDVITKTKKWIPRIFPSAKFNNQKKIWTFEDGETLWLNYARVPDDYEQYHGHEYTISVDSIVRSHKGKVRANDVKVGDFLQTLQGYGKVTKVLRSNKPGVKVSVLDEDLNLVGQQHQGLIHPVLTNAGWQRQGLSCLFDISEQSFVGQHYIKEVFQFLFGVHQEILVVSQLSLYSVESHSIFVNISKWYSCLYQIFHQFLRLIAPVLSSSKFQLYEIQENLLACRFEKVLEIFSEEWSNEHASFLQLLQHCSFLINFVRRIHSNYVHLVQSNEYYTFLSSFSQGTRKHLKDPQQSSLKCFHLSQKLLASESIQNHNVLSGIYLNAHSDLHKERDFLDDNCVYSHPNDERLLPVLISDQEQSPLSFGEVARPLLCANKVLDFSYLDPYSACSHSKISVPFDNELRLFSFSVSSCSSPIDMIDFEIENDHHYLSFLDIVTDKKKEVKNNISDIDHKQYQIVSSNCWIGWEELTNHPFDTLYLKLMSCNRSSNSNIPLKYRSTCNPSGPGHQWVKARFIDKGPPGKIVKENVEVIYPNDQGDEIKKILTITRTHIQSYASENRSLMKADPLYMAKIFELTKDNDMLRKAWIDGSWDLIIGGFFTDVWDKKIHVLPTFRIPHSWKLYRSFDWGSSKPWAVTYAFESNGEQPNVREVDGRVLPYFPKGSIIVPNEIYGWNGTVNVGDQAISQEIAERVLSVDNKLYTEYGSHCIPGPADTSIWDVKDGTSIGANLEAHGCKWTRAYKGAGSRIAGWALIRQMLGAAKRQELETPHLYFFPQAEHHIRTLPIMQRDEKKPEDIDTDLEDHCFVYDTEIMTDKGIKKIGDLVGKVGQVLSVNGKFVDFYNCRLVKKHAVVLEVTFSDNHKVICTPDHKFLTTSGFVEARNLLTSSDIYCIVSKPNFLKGDLLCKIMGLRKFRYYQRPNKSLMGKFIINVVNTFKKMGKDYIDQFMNFIMGKYQRVLRYIIKNWILQKIKILIWNYYQKVNIVRFMQMKEIFPHLQNMHWKKQQSGIEVKKDENGTNNILRTPKNFFIKKLVEIVKIVGRFVKLQEKKWMFTVQENVKLNGEKNQELMMLKETVQYATIHLQLTNTQPVKPVQVNAHQNYVVGITGISIVSKNYDVYCLTVPKYHTFALKNGVIVSNCMDSLRYFIARKLTSMKRRKVLN